MSADVDRPQTAPEGQRPKKKTTRFQAPQITLIGHSSSSSKVQTREGRQIRGITHKGYFESLKPSELGNLRTIFDRVDPGHTGFVLMDEFFDRLDKARVIDGFLKTAYNFMMHSISKERREGFKSFRDIVALLLPTASPAKVDTTIQAGEQWMLQRKEKRASVRLSRGRLSNAERIQAVARKAAITSCFMIDKDSDGGSDEDVSQEVISLSSLQELKYMFASLDRHGNGYVDVRDLERYFGTQDDVRSLFHRMTTKIGEQQHRKINKLDFDGFLKLMLPHGFQPCKYPDPDKVPTATSDQIFRWLHDDNPPFSKDKEAHGPSGENFAGAKEPQGLGSSQRRSVRPASASDGSMGDHSNINKNNSSSSLSKGTSSLRKSSLSKGVSLPNLPGLPSLSTYELRQWQRTPMESRTLK